MNRFHRFLLAYYPVSTIAGAIYGWHNIHSLSTFKGQQHKQESFSSKIFGGTTGFLLGPYYAPMVMLWEISGYRTKAYFVTEEKQIKEPGHLWEAHVPLHI